jgi:two-component system phosphate regulon sensor histidine kinase PhoR
MADAEFSWEPPKNRFAPPGTGVSSQKLSDEVLIGNARWFIVFRWVIIGALLLFQILAIVFSDILTQIGITHQQGWPIVVIVVLFIANISYIYALDFRRSTKYNSPSINIWCQIIIDLLCLSIVVHYVGSTATPAPFFYVLHIALSCIFFSTRESLIVTLLVCAMYTFILLIENSMFYQLFVAAPADPHTSAEELQESRALLWMFTLDTLFIVVWYVVSRLTIVVRTHERDLVGAYERITLGQVEKINMPC